MKKFKIQMLLVIFLASIVAGCGPASKETKARILNLGQLQVENLKKEKAKTNELAQKSLSVQTRLFQSLRIIQEKRTEEKLKNFKEEIAKSYNPQEKLLLQQTLKILDEWAGILKEEMDKIQNLSRLEAESNSALNAGIEDINERMEIIIKTQEVLNYYILDPGIDLTPLIESIISSLQKKTTR